jgi:Flp pilus assembly protein TadG
MRIDHSANRPRGGGPSCRDDTGAAALEFAIVLPLLLALVLGVFEFGRAWNIHQTITDTAREGARRAVVRDGANKEAVVAAVIQNRLTAARIQWDGTVDYTADCSGWEPPVPQAEEVTVSGCGWGRDTGEEARVVIAAPYPFNFLRPVLRLLASGSNIGPTMMSTNFVMRNE